MPRLGLRRRGHRPAKTKPRLGEAIPPARRSVACQAVARCEAASEGWSGRRGSNPRPTAWKAVTLPLSYSRLRAHAPRSVRASAGQARHASRRRAPSLPLPSRSFTGLPSRPTLRLPLRRDRGWPATPKLAAQPRAKAGGEGRTRTFEAARATDLQSAAFDRFATSPVVCVMETRAFGASRSALLCRFHPTAPSARRGSPVELAKGFEPPTR